MKPIALRASLAVTSLALLTSAVHGQTCMGGASFKQRTAQIGGELSRGQSFDVATAGVSLGDTHGTFASVGLGRVHDDSLHDDAAVFSARAGVGIPLPSVPETELCPFISFVTIRGTDFPTGESASVREYGAGLGVGTRLGSELGFEAVPFATAALVLATERVQLGGEPFGGADDHFVSTAFGVGFVIQKVFTVTPLTTFDIAHGQTTWSYGLRLAFAFGRVTPRTAPPPGDGSLATVWVNPRAMLYYCSGAQWYGGTAGGSFMTEREALAAGYSPDRGKRC